MKNRLLLAALFGAVACGGDDGGGSESKTIGAQGGTVRSSDGKVSVAIPAGALSSDISITIEKTSDAAGSIAGTSYAIKAPSIELSAPATITIEDPTANALMAAMPMPTVWIDCNADDPVCAYVWKGVAECPPDHPIWDGFAELETPAGDTLYRCKLAVAPKPIIVLKNIPFGDTTSSGVLLSTDIMNLGNDTMSVVGDDTPPTISLTSSKVTIASFDTFVLNATVNDNVGVSEVEFFRLLQTVEGTGDSAVVKYELHSLGVVKATPFAYPLELFGGPDGPIIFAARAKDKAGNLSVGVAQVTVTVDSGVVNTGPSVVLSASSTNVTAAGDVTLTANVTSSAAVTKVEFFEGSTKLGEDTTSPYTQTLSFIEASNGAHSYFAKVTDANAMTANSNNVGISVDIGAATTFDFYVDPVNGDDLANGTSAATAFRSLCKAKTASSAGNHIALMDGVHDYSSSGFCQVTFSYEIHFAAVNNGAAILEVPIIMKAAGSVRGLLVRNGPQYKGGFQFSGVGGQYAVTLSHITFGDIKSQTNSIDFPILINGNATVTWQAAGDDVFTVPVPATGYGYTLAHVADNDGHLIVQGGAFHTASAATDDTYCNPLFMVSQGELVLSGVDLAHKGTLLRLGNGKAVLDSNTTYVNHATVTNLFCYEGVHIEGLSTLELDNATLTGSHGAIKVFPHGADSSTITLSNGATLQNFTEYGVYANPGAAGGSVTLNLANATVRGSAAMSLTPVGVLVDGLSLLTARNTSFSGNDIGLFVNATAFGSDIDLGTANDGGNHFEGNGTTGIKVQWDPAPAAPKYVSASGNFWNAGVQGAVSGSYNAGTNDSGAKTGQNYILVGTNDGIEF